MNRSYPTLKAAVIDSRQGSALLIALLLMGFLAVFGLGVSRLIVNSIRIERTVVEAGKAYFAAEGAVEEGLYWNENRLPGFEVAEEDAELTYLNDATAQYDMTAVGTTVPCEHRPTDENGEYWRELRVNESVSLPLFKWDEESGSRVDLASFAVNFEVDRGDANPPVSGTVLRWKILGIDETEGHTEAISGILEFDTNVENSVGSDDTANFYDGESGSTFVNYSDYPISTFLEHHQFNTLTLTNVIVPEVQPLGATGADENILKVQLTTADGSPCEYTLIEADGESGETLQSIDVQIKLDSFLPVFDFALYETSSNL